MSNIWVITDTHFGHDRLVEKNLRPKEFESKILKFVNNNIKSDDITIHLGDVSFSNEDYWNVKFCMATSGKKWLVIGNHDKKSINWYLDHGWDFCADTISVDQFGKKILFSHIPIKDGGLYDINIHGHFHNWNNHHKHEPEICAILNDKHYLMAIEDLNYQAVTLNSILKKFGKK